MDVESGTSGEAQRRRSVELAPRKYAIKRTSLKTQSAAHETKRRRG